MHCFTKYITNICNKSQRLYQFIHGYIFRLQLRAITRPFINNDAINKKIYVYVYCIKVNISPCAVEMGYKCTKPFRCIRNMKDSQSWNACVCVFLYFINLATFSLNLFICYIYIYIYITEPLGPAYACVCVCVYIYICRSQWSRGLKRRSAAARPLRLWVRIPMGAWMPVCCEFCVLSGRGLSRGVLLAVMRRCV